MTQIFLDATFRGKLLNLTQPLELCDETGKLLARLMPVLDPSQWEPAEEPYLSPEELERRRHGPDFSTAEVVAYLEKL
jgi:hypothetical protein